MSGSSGGGGGGGSSDSVTCNNLRFSTQVATPQPAIASVVVGDILDVQILLIGASQAVAVLKAGQIVGGLAGGLVNRLRECLLGGNNFSAEVMTVNGAQVTLQIEPI